MAQSGEREQGAKQTSLESRSCHETLQIAGVPGTEILF